MWKYLGRNRARGAGLVQLLVATLIGATLIGSFTAGMTFFMKGAQSVVQLDSFEGLKRDFKVIAKSFEACGHHFQDIEGNVLSFPTNSSVSVGKIVVGEKLVAKKDMELRGGLKLVDIQLKDVGLESKTKSLENGTKTIGFQIASLKFYLHDADGADLRHELPIHLEIPVDENGLMYGCAQEAALNCEDISEDEESPYILGMGKESSPYKICNPHQFNNIRDGSFNPPTEVGKVAPMKAHYILDNDIDMSVITDGHYPIADDETAPFSGVFDGNDKTISNFRLVTMDSNMGLFRSADGAEIKNLKLNNVNIRGEEKVGLLAGHFASGSITNVHATGIVIGNISVGGLVGYLLRGKISQSSANVKTTASTRYGGGLVGFAFGSEGSVEESYAKGDVKGGMALGGLVGRANTAIDNTYATGSVGDPTSTLVGGLVGSTGSFVTRSFAIGQVQGSENVGGLIGKIKAHSLSIGTAFSTGAFPSTGAYVGALVGYLDVPYNSYPPIYYSCRQRMPFAKCMGAINKIYYWKKRVPEEKAYAGGAEDNIEDLVDPSHAVYSGTNLYRVKAWDFDSTWKKASTSGCHFPLLSFQEDDEAIACPQISFEACMDGTCYEVDDLNARVSFDSRGYGADGVTPYFRLNGTKLITNTGGQSMETEDASLKVGTNRIQIYSNNGHRDYCWIHNDAVYGKIEFPTTGDSFVSDTWGRVLGNIDNRTYVAKAMCGGNDCCYILIQKNLEVKIKVTEPMLAGIN